MVINATFNNISVISWWSVLLVEETGGPGKTTDLSQVTDKLYHILLYTSPWSRFELTASAVIGTDYIGIVVNSTTIRSQPWRLQKNLQLNALNIGSLFAVIHQSKVLEYAIRCQRGNQKSWIKEGQTIQWSKGIRRKGKQRSTKHYAEHEAR